jgi:membrane protein implicated in regulation of membrane protease activity
VDHVLHIALLAVGLATFFVAPLAVAIPALLVIGGVAIAMFVAVNRALHLPPKTGNESVAGGVGTVVAWERGTGLVRHKGELWQASSTSTFRPKDSVRIVRAEGTVLHVRPDNDEQAGRQRPTEPR